MEQLYKSIENIVSEEYQRASEKYGEKHHSQHEAYAVIRKEFQEAVEELNATGDCIESDFWNNVRSDLVAENQHVARDIYHCAIMTACEAVQIAAMAHKALCGYEREDNQ